MGGFDALLSAASHDIPALHGVALLSPAVDQTSFLAGPFADVITAARCGS
jgi:alpha-beta hydrolase superfamily lysophospholipase